MFLLYFSSREYLPEKFSILKQFNRKFCLLRNLFVLSSSVILRNVAGILGISFIHHLCIMISYLPDLTLRPNAQERVWGYAP